MASVSQQKIYQLMTAIGSALLLLGILGNAYLVWHNIMLHRETQQKAVRLQQVELQVRDWQQLFQELLQYSSKQPALDPILQKYGLKQAPAAPQKTR